MKTWYIAVLSALLVVMAGCCAATVKKKSEYSGVILRLMVSGIVAAVSYILFLFSGNLTQALLFDGFYFICTDWMLLCMLGYVCRYTDVRLHTPFFRILLVGIAGADTVSMLVNMQTGHMFRLEETVHEGTGLVYWSAEFMPMHYWHLGFCYVLAGITFAILIGKLLRTSKIYRKMYYYTIIPFVVVLAVNAVCYSTDYPLDFSLFFYALLAICICYGSLYAAPRGLLEDTLVNVVADFNNGIVCFDLKGKCIYANSKACEMFMVGEEDGYARLEQYYRDWKQQNRSDSEDYAQWEEEHEVNGVPRSFHMEYQRLKDEKNAVMGAFFKLTDRTDEIRRFREEQYLATHDRLTGLYNREYFFQKAGQILQRRPDVERFMVCTNIKNFKLVNDLFGEEIGDRVLVDQASLLKFANYEDCIQGRIGADRFAMLIAKEHFTEDLAVKTTGRLQYLINDSNYKIHIVLGVYKIEDPAESPQVMYDKASMAIESIQGDYQKTVVYYDTNILNRLLHEKSVVSEFEDAINAGQFRMYLQPLVGTDGRAIGAEALVRWMHPAQGLIMPVNFISIVEKTGLIIRLDEYMWELAARKLKDWKDRGRGDMSISVNISAKDFYYTDLYRVFTGLVEKYDISPGSLKLEITETVLMTDLDMHLKILTGLQEYGFCIEIDDFGSGYSSLNMLKDIKADILKIDMLFLRETENKARSRAILSSVISMAKSLDMSVIAEGVETAEQRDFLTEMGCDIFQGYYFSKPIPVEEFEERYMEA
ncbi:MAG: EAL domain-containing protein [Firmicutes bacterium]|nr:EAL domain-containing protein [Bacillota bacterium]